MERFGDYNYQEIIVKLGIEESFNIMNIFNNTTHHPFSEAEEKENE